MTTPTTLGLTTAEAARRLGEHGPNAIPEARPPSVAGRVVAQLRDPMILLLLAAAALTIALRDVPDTIVIALVVVLNTAVGVAQELRAQQAVTALRQLSAPVARVVRDGSDTVVPARDVVVGDAIRLEAGDVVPADAQIIESAQLQCDESALTGESVPVDKGQGGSEGTDDVSAGTVVTKGRATARVVRTGADSALGRIAALLAETRPRPTPLQKRLASLGGVLAVTAIGLSLIVMLSGLLRGEPPAEMVITAVSLAVAAVPESLPAVVTLALALGAHRMAARRALVRRLPAVETLGSVSLLAVDKTGTLTQNRMVVQQLWVGNERYDVTGAGYAPAGEIRAAQPGAVPPEHLSALLRDVVLCNDADLEPPDGSGRDWRPLGDPTEVALVTLAMKAGLDVTAVRGRHRRIGEVPFDSVRKRMTSVHELDDGQRLVICKGAPEVLLGTPGLLADDGQLAAAARRAELLARDGFRVLAVAEAVRDRAPAGTEEQGLRLTGLVAIVDPPREQARAAVSACQAAGVRLLMITGDHPATARAIASRLGIGSPEQPVVTGDQLARGTQPRELADTHVFARTRPEQKLDIIAGWQRLGSVVAMTGDGVNDAPALRAADIGVAMGRGGTDVARQAADLVLTDDELFTVVAAIEEGRRIYTNIRRFLRYALSGGLAEVVVMLTGPFLGFPVPLLPAQILWVNMLTHGLPGVALGAEPADPGSMTEPPTPPEESVLGRGLVRQIAVTGVLISVVTLLAGWWAQHHGAPWQTVVFLVLGLSQLGVALALRQRAGLTQGPRRPRFLDVAVGGALALQLAGVYLPPLQLLLHTEAIAASDLAAATALAAIPGLLLAVARGRRSRTEVADTGGAAM